MEVSSPARCPAADHAPRLPLQRAARRRHLRRATTLAELAVSMVVSGLLLAGIASAIVVSTRSLPRTEEMGIERNTNTRLAGSLLAELQNALFISERGANAIAFTVADRDGDGRHERIRYAWAGKSGDPLTRAYNGATAVEVIEGVDALDFTYLTRPAVESYPGPPIESAEMTLASYTGAFNLNEYKVKDKEWCGQHFQPDFGAFPNALSWKVSRAYFEAKRDGNADNNFYIELRTADGSNKPTGTILESYLIPESALTTSQAWYYLNFNSVNDLTPGQGLCLVFRHPNSGNPSANIRLDQAYPRGLLTTTNSGGSWTYESGKTLRYTITGTISQPGLAQSATRTFIEGVRVKLHTSGGLNAQVEDSVTPLNLPQVLNGYWHADFSSDPTLLDINGDGTGDWVRRGGSAFATGNLSGGVWDAQNTLDARNPLSVTGTLITATVVFSNADMGGDGPTVNLNPGRAGGINGRLQVTLQLQPDGTQRLTLHERQSASTRRALATVSGLPAGMVTARLLIDTSKSTVNLQVNQRQQGTVIYAASSDSTAEPLMSLSRGGSGSRFDLVTLRVGNNNP